MILIITHKSDYTADYLINKLNENSISYYRLNCEDIPKTNYSLTYSKKFNLELKGITNFHSVWFRRTKLPDLDDIKDLQERAYIINEFDALLTNFYYTIKADKWLSFPENIYKAENKVYQLKIASTIGFKIPDTLVTNNIIELQAFCKRCNYDVIIKPLSHGRIAYEEETKLIYTNKLKKEHIENLNSFSLTPSIFQKNIEKEYEIRVTMVGNKVFSAKVNSQENEETKIDWRRKKLTFSSYILPHNIEVLCIDLLKKLDISFGAIDLIKSIDGEYYFLEINPNGQWAWIEIDTKAKISDAIIDYLLN
ncbi:MAG TPA: hypothetical protein VN698_12630 [Bacteroidia bacterium]|nr:hypothetical protein [Bacteroidia bacterium]